jgi:hypothetical protein
MLHHKLTDNVVILPCHSPCHLVRLAWSLEIVRRKLTVEKPHYDLSESRICRLEAACRCRIGVSVGSSVSGGVWVKAHAKVRG